MAGEPKTLLGVFYLHDIRLEDHLVLRLELRGVVAPHFELEGFGGLDGLRLLL